MANYGVSWAPEPLRPRVIRRTVERIELHPDERHEYRVKFKGQRTFIRASRQMTEQVIAFGLGEVIIDTITDKTVER